MRAIAGFATGATFVAGRSSRYATLELQDVQDVAPPGAFAEERPLPCWEKFQVRYVGAARRARRRASGGIRGGKTVALLGEVPGTLRWSCKTCKTSRLRGHSRRKDRCLAGRTAPPMVCGRNQPNQMQQRPYSWLGKVLRVGRRWKDCLEGWTPPQVVRR